MNAAWSTIPPEKTAQFVKYVPVGYSDTHSLTVGYLFWLVGFSGAHRFYYGKPLTRVLWFFTFGLLGIGWRSTTGRISTRISGLPDQRQMAASEFHCVFRNGFGLGVVIEIPPDRFDQPAQISGLELLRIG